MMFFLTTFYLLLSLLSIAIFTLFERKVLGVAQHRQGPSKVGMKGLFQPFSDALKLFSKNSSNPEKSNKVLYFLSSMFFFFVPLFLLLSKPFSWGMSDFKTFLYILMFFSLNIYGSIVTGWASNSKYSLLGSIRSVAQTLSYEMVLSTLFMFMILVILSFVYNIFFKINTTYLLFPLSFFMIFLFLVFTIEVNRTPFDLSECESELVSGFNVEYGAIEFSLIFLGENLMIIVSSLIMASIFFSGNNMTTLLFIFIFIWIRASFPRIRFDKMMHLCWLKLLPLGLNVSWVMFLVCL